MSDDVTSAIVENQASLATFEAAARASSAEAWARPPAEGRWCPGQVVEHVARSYEEASAALSGTSPKPAMPRLVRPLLRWLLLSKVVKTGWFPKGAKAPAGSTPSATPAPRDAALARLRASAAAFERDVAATTATTIMHPVFGRLRAADYVRVLAVHATHHVKQLNEAR